MLQGITGNAFSNTAATTCATQGGNFALAPGASCNFVLRFAPTTTGVASGILSVSSEAGIQTATLTGTGVPDAPRLVISPSTFYFPAVPTGTTETQVVTLTNAGTEPASFHSSYGDTSCFSATNTCPNTVPTVLAPRASCNYTVSFTADYGASSGNGGPAYDIFISGSPGTNSVTSELIGYAGPAATNPVSIDDGNGFMLGSLALNGVATVTSNVLQLTANQPSQASSAFYPTQVPTGSFTSDVGFQLLDPDAEGITFTIQANGPNAIGSSGGGLGYQGIGKSIALKFDLRNTAGEGTNSTGIYVNGAAPTQPSISLDGSGIDLHSGHIFALHLAYDGTTEAVTLTDTITKAVFTTSVAEDIPGIVGTTAYFGFTAATGASTASVVDSAATAGASLSTTANILYWNYVNQSMDVTPIATLAPTSLNFGNVTVDSTTPVQNATLTNIGAAQFQVASVTPSDPSIVVHTSYCARPVVPGSYCELHVQFSPTATGPFSGTVVINYFLGDGSNPSQNYTSTLTVTGTGVASGVTLTPASADFGSVAGGSTSSPQIFTVTNKYATAVSLTRIETADSFGGAAFQVGAGATCISGGQLPAGGSCTIPLAFAPTNNGADSGTLYVSYLDPSGGAVTQTAHLTGTGTGAFATLSPANYSYGNVGIGTINRAGFTFTNTGTVPLNITGLTIKGDASSFLIYESGTPCSGTLALGASCNIGVAFVPGAAGNFVGSLNIASNAGTTLSSLTGTAVLPAATLTPANCNYGNVGVNTINHAGFTLTNTGPVPFSITGLTITGDTSSFLIYTGDSCPGTLALGASCNIGVAFVPGAVGRFTGSIAIQSDDSLVTVPNSFTGTAVLPTATLTPSNYNYGNVSVDTINYANFTLTNTGLVPFDIQGLTITGDTSSFRIYTGDSCPGTLALGASCNIGVAFTPGPVGKYTGSIAIHSDDSLVTVPNSFTGTAVLPTATLTPASYNFGDVGTGTTVQAVFTFTNTGIVPIPLTGANVNGGGFSLVETANMCGSGTVVALGASCILGVSFQAAALGTATGTVEATLPTGEVTASLSATGVASGPQPQEINLANGFTPNALTITGPATVSNGVLELTNGPSTAASSAFFPTPVSTSNFTTDLTFQLLDPTAEGITFTIQGDGQNAVGSGGGGLGYRGLAKSIALKFDLKNAAGEGTDSTGVYVDGAAPTVSAISLASFGIDLHSGHIFDLHLAYDGTTESINLADTVTKAVWSTELAEDIPGIVGSNTAYVGFTAGSGMPAGAAAITERAAISAATPSTAAPAATATSNIISWTYTAVTSKGAAQTITFPALAAETYGAPRINLAATATSGLPVSYTVTGPAVLSGSALTITGAGEVTVTATQSGNASFAPATPVSRSFGVAKAALTVTAVSLSRAYRTPNPALHYTIGGFVNGDTASVVSGMALLTTTATSTSAAGTTYRITFSSEGLTAANYSFTYVAGVLTVVPSLVGTATTLVADPNTNLMSGQPITLTATVTASSGTVIPTGTVDFIDPAGGSATVALDGSGKAVYRGVVPAAETYSVFASYSGTSGFAKSQSATITAAVTAP